VKITKLEIAGRPRTTRKIGATQLVALADPRYNASHPPAAFHCEPSKHTLNLQRALWTLLVFPRAHLREGTNFEA
jgi:hypothetical protein